MLLKFDRCLKDNGNHHSTTRSVMSSLSEIQHALYDQVVLQSYAPTHVKRVKDKATRNRNQHEIVLVSFTKKITLDKHRHCHSDLLDAINGQSKQVAKVMS